MDEEALLEWLGGRSYRKLSKRQKKIKDRADEDNGNDDKSSQDYIPMEKVSREYIKIKGQEDKKELDKKIRASLKPRSEAKDEKSVAPAEAAMDEPANEYLEQKKHYDKLKRNKQIKEQLQKDDPDYVPSMAEKKREAQKEYDKKLKEGKSTAPEGAKSVATTPVPPPIAPQLTQLQPPGAADFKPEASSLQAPEKPGPDNAQQANPLAPQAEANTLAPTARLPSLAGQQLPTEIQPIANVPGDYGEGKGIDIGKPTTDKSLPLQLDIPAGEPEQGGPSDSVLDELSAEYQRATSKPITLLGRPIDPASKAYEAVDRAIAPLQLFNEGLLKAPTGFARLANFINYPLDKLTGTEAFSKNNKLFDKADSFIDRLEVTRQPTNMAERAMTAIGMLAVPNPAAVLSAPAVGVGVSLNEGIHQIGEAVQHRLAKNPRVQNKYDELEPTVTSVDGKTAKEVQQKLDADARSFITRFSEANFTDTMLYTAGALATLGGLVKYRQYLKSNVSGRTIMNPETPIVEQAPQSITTAGEVLRSANQDANYGLESQARKFNDLDLVHDISTSTRAGMAARVENLIESGAVNTPGYSTQLSVSPKKLVEFHLSRPEQEQQDVSRAFHILDQMDHAKLVQERKAGAKQASEQGEKPRLRGPQARTESAPRSVRQQIEDAYSAETGGNSSQFVTLDKIRARLKDVPREQVDSELSNFTSGRDKSAKLSQLTDPKARTTVVKDAAYSPAGEPFHSIFFEKLEKPKAVEAASEVPTSRATASRDFMSTAPEAPYAKMPPEPDIQWAQQLLAQPENAGVVRAMKEIREAKAKVAESAGRWDAETTANMLSKRPNYVHRIEAHDSKVVDGKVVPKTRLEAMSDAMLSKRGDVDHLEVSNPELSSALERERVNPPNQMVDAVLANVDDLKKTSVFAHENDIRKRWFEGVLNDESTAKSVMKLEKGDKVPHGFETASFYKDGELQRYAVEPSIARALKFSPTTAASRYNTANMIRNAFQQATTGPVLAPFFAPTAFAMESSLISATRNRGMRVGNIDAGMQAVSGKHVGAPGDMFGTMAAGVGAVYRAQRADRLLHAIQKTEDYLLRYGNRSLQDIEGQMPGFVKKLSRGLALGQDATLENVLHQSRQLYEQTAKGWALKNGALHASQNELMRNANKFYAEDVLTAFQKQLGHEEGAGWYDWFKESVLAPYKHLVLNIHDGPRLALVEANRGRVGDKELAYTTRKASGDLGVRGAGNAETGYILSNDVSKAAQIATKALTGKAVGSVLDFGYASIPYINPHIQGSVRFLDQLAKQPVSTIAGAINSTTVPMLGTLGFAGALAASGRPEYLDYMLNKREEYKKTGYIYIPIPGRPAQDGLDIRIDPVLAPFGYPAIEAIDSVFGLRKMLAQQQGRLAPNAEQQGLMSALSDGLKEAIGFGMPIQASIALASQSIAPARNMLDPSFAMKSEQASKLGSGKSPGSGLSVPMQMMLENVLGATAQHAIAGIDAYASTGKNESALGNAAKGAAFSFASKAPVVGTILAGKNFNESGTALADNTRKLTSSAKRIVAGIQNAQNILLKSANAQAGAGDMMPAIKMGNPGITSLPPEVQNNMDGFNKLLNANGKLKGINSERSAISTSLTGLRGINAGNLSRHLLVPLKEGREIGGLGYTILNEELLKQELAKEEDSRVHPKMTKGGATRDPKIAKQQRAQIIKDLVGDVPKISRGKVQSPEGEFYRSPSLKEVQALKNALNERRYTLDLEAADEYEDIEKQLGVKLNDVAKKVKLTPEAEAAMTTSE